jgi:hypothetical protein
VHVRVLELNLEPAERPVKRKGGKLRLWSLVALGVVFACALFWSLDHRTATVSAALAASAPKPGQSDPGVSRAVPAPADVLEQAEDATEPAAETSPPEPTAEDCALCLRTVCSSEVAAGASVEAAECLIPCEYWMPKAMCESGNGPPQFYRAPPRPLCAGYPRTRATLALVECGKACPCPVMRWNEPPAASRSVTTPSATAASLGPPN